MAKFYKSDDAGSGQHGICGKCKKGPTKEGHDGCLGTLTGPVMNACCGHGNDDQAYIQYWGGMRIAGDEAVAEQTRLILAAQYMVKSQKLHTGQVKQKAEAGVDKEGSELLAHTFNRMNLDQKNGFPDDVKKRIGGFMFNNGYRVVFDRFYLQAEPNKKLPKRLLYDRTK